MTPKTKLWRFDLFSKFSITKLTYRGEIKNFSWKSKKEKKRKTFEVAIIGLELELDGDTAKPVIEVVTFLILCHSRRI